MSSVKDINQKSKDPHQFNSIRDVLNTLRSSFIGEKTDREIKKAIQAVDTVVAQHEIEIQSKYYFADVVKKEEEPMLIEQINEELKSVHFVWFYSLVLYIEYSCLYHWYTSKIISHSRVCE